MKLSPETLLATAHLQIELLNNQLVEANLRAQRLQGRIHELERSARLADQARRDAVPSLFGGVTEAAEMGGAVCSYCEDSPGGSRDPATDLVTEAHAATGEVVMQNTLCTFHVADVRHSYEIGSFPKLRLDIQPIGGAS